MERDRHRRGSVDSQKGLLNFLTFFYFIFFFFLRYAMRLKTHSGPNATPEDKQLAALWWVYPQLCKQGTKLPVLPDTSNPLVPSYSNSQKVHFSRQCPKYSDQRIRVWVVSLASQGNRKQQAPCFREIKWRIIDTQCWPLASTRAWTDTHTHTCTHMHTHTHVKI